MLPLVLLIMVLNSLIPPDHQNTVPMRSYYLNEHVVLETLWSMGVILNLSGNAAAYEDVLKTTIRLSRYTQAICTTFNKSKQVP